MHVDLGTGVKKVLRRIADSEGGTWRVRYWPMWVALLSLLTFVALSARYKVAGIEAVRPFHFAAMLGVVFLSVIALWDLVKRRAFVGQEVKILSALLLCVLIQGLEGGYRSTADSFYVLANVMGFFLLFIFLGMNIQQDVLRKAASTTLVVIVFCVCGLACISWMTLLPSDSLHAYVVSDGGQMLLPFLQSPTYLDRMHGLFGDPTVFGVFCAFTSILTLQLYPDAKKWPQRLGMLLLVANVFSVIGLLGSGSRMGIIALVGMLLSVARYDYRRSLAGLLLATLAVPLFYGLNVIRVTTHSNLLFPHTQHKSTTIVSHYATESLRVRGAGGFEERQVRFTKALTAMKNTSMSGVVFGCGVECAQHRGSVSFVGYLDLIQNHGVLFLAGLIFLVVTVFMGLTGNTYSIASVLLLGCLVVEIFGYWLFAPFFNPVQMTFAYVLAYSCISRLPREHLRHNDPD